MESGIINSDQGSQFTSEAYIDLLKENGIKISMDGKGRTDNQRIERFQIIQGKSYILKNMKQDMS